MRLGEFLVRDVPAVGGGIVSRLLLSLMMVLSTIESFVTADESRSHAVALASPTVALGSTCESSAECLPGAWCGDRHCRRSSCVHNFECARGELCHYGRVDGEWQSACFAFNGREHKTDFCPGGGRPTLNAGGYIETCDLEAACGGRAICNPIYGVCCSRLRACPFPRQPVLESDSHRPLVCQLRGGRQVECPLGSTCERLSGFCCSSGNEDAGDGGDGNRDHDGDEHATGALIELVRPESGDRRPAPGGECRRGDKCGGGATCVCPPELEVSVVERCECRCVRSAGFTLDVETNVCRRTRRRLKEKCKSDLECQSAYSECASGGCRCRAGFQRDGHGGCRAVAYRCVNNAEPLKYDDRVVGCIVARDERSSAVSALAAAPRISATPTTIGDRPHYVVDAIARPHRQSRALPSTAHATGAVESESLRECPHRHYCVAIFDVPKRSNLYQGFCCPLPQPNRPVCPVGNAHETSQPPDFGCAECPWQWRVLEVGCHLKTSRLQICCPRPCLSPDDVYVGGQCFAIAAYGESCLHDEQCVGQLSAAAAMADNRGADMSCIDGVCACERGFHWLDGVCQRLVCTIGLKSEPSVDSVGRVQRCARSFDCPNGYMCDVAQRICCKGANRCPKDYVETGRLCEANDLCADSDNEVCVRARKGKQRLCCRLEQLAVVKL